jgi:CTP:molybdopterin cytidylyltransferase MocA
MTGSVGLLLAASGGPRFGGPKALARLDGERLVDRAVRTLRAGGLVDVLVVSGAAPLPDVDAVEVPNPSWREGMGSSLRAGLAAAADGGWLASVVLLVDTPWVGPGAVARLLAATRPETVAAQATYAGAAGHPVLLARPVWADVAASAVGDRGARSWLAANPGLVLAVPADGTGDPRDVDRPEDLGQSSGPGASPG